ncbi:SRPBCC family protein [Spirillospora sp. NPDC047279]|uniref:SRPBCC family protein n=1 Tax=Spirillospora sp. NPDC047279 TaxID=3155478 RepID=UPI0033CECBC9
MPYEIEVTATAACSPETVFKHLAVPEAWSEWGRFPARARQARQGDEQRYGVGSVKKVPPVREETVVFDPPFHFAYVALSGMPVRNYRSDVRLEERDGATFIRWQAVFDPLIPGTGPFLRVGLRLMLAAFVRWLSQHVKRCDASCASRQLLIPAP